jgi:hypothetical protein
MLDLLFLREKSRLENQNTVYPDLVESFSLKDFAKKMRRKLF